MSPFRLVVTFLPPAIAGASIAWAQMAHRHAKAAQLQVKFLSEALSEASAALVASGLGYASKIYPSDNGFFICLRGPEDWHEHFSYDAAADTFFHLGDDMNEEIHPGDNDCDLPLVACESLLDAKIKYLEIRKERRIGL